jgi:F0F1-type ATP synthase assembly protein I
MAGLRDESGKRVFFAALCWLGFCVDRMDTNKKKENFMFIADLLVALVFGFFIVWAVTSFFGTKGPWDSFLWFFLVVGLFAWFPGGLVAYVGQPTQIYQAHTNEGRGGDGQGKPDRDRLFLLAVGRMFVDFWHQSLLLVSPGQLKRV